MRPVIVLGAAGLVGGWASRHLADPTQQVVTVDRTGAVDHTCDVLFPSPAVREEVGRADVVVLALPEETVLDCLVWLGAVAAPGALLVNTCSVQRPAFERAASIGLGQPHIGVNPLFSPRW
jgi:4-amino-4-deoxyprephenate dehydrogenase